MKVLARSNTAFKGRVGKHCSDGSAEFRALLCTGSFPDPHGPFSQCFLDSLMDHREKSEQCQQPWVAAHFTSLLPFSPASKTGVQYIMKLNIFCRIQNNVSFLYTMVILPYQLR